MLLLVPQLAITAISVLLLLVLPLTIAAITVLEDIPANTPLEFMITVHNGPYRNAAPTIRVEMSGRFRFWGLGVRDKGLGFSVKACTATPRLPSAWK